MIVRVIAVQSRPDRVVGTGDVRRTSGDPFKRRGHTRAEERWLTCRKFEQHRSEREQVGTRVDGRSTRLLWIWFSPRQTFRQLSTAGASSSWIVVYTVAMLGTFLEFVNTNWAMGRLGAISWLTIVPLQLAVAWVALWTAAWFLAVYGRWRGGCGTAAQLRVALGWACVPPALTVMCWAPIWILNDGPILEGPPLESVGQIIAGVLWLYVEAEPIWGVTLLILAVAEAHRFSLWKAVEVIACSAVVGLMTFFGLLVIASA